MQKTLPAVSAAAIAAVKEAIVAEQNNDKKKLALKIILPILIVAAIAGIWFVKANEDDFKTKAAQTEAAQTDTTEQSAEMTTEEAKPDFVLSASGVDLEQLKSYGLPIIIDFGADSCIPCKEMAPVLEKMNEEWQGKVIVKFVDVWKNPGAADNFPVQVIPTQFIFDAEGKPYVPSDAVEIQFQMYSANDTNEHIYTAHQGGLTEENFRAIFVEMGIE